MAVSNEYQLQVYRGSQGLAAIRDPWQRLMQHLNAKGYWHYYEWYQSYLEHLEPEPQWLFFFALYKKEEIQAILPLKYLVRSFKGVPLKVLELPRHPHVKLKDIIFPAVFQTDAAVEALLNGLKRLRLPSWDVIAMQDLLPDAYALDAFSRTSYTKIIEPHDSCDSIPIGTSPDSIYDGMSRQMKKALKMANKRAASLGVLTSDAIRHPRDLEAAFQVFLALESSGWKGPRGSGTAIVCDPKLLAFYTSLLRNFGALGKCEVALLHLNEEPIAGTFSLIVDDTSYSLKIAYDESKANLSPGNLQREKLMAQYTQDSITSLNLVSGSASSWHRRWNVNEQKTYRMYIFNRSTKAMMAFAMKKAKKKIKTAFRDKLEMNNLQDA